jgi:glycerol-3-phosphate acyltransferase PlsX
VLLKSIQGTAKAVMDWMKDEASRSLILKALLAIAYPVLRRLKTKIDYARTGGALLLGVKKPVVIAHGSSKEEAITQAILFAQKTIDQKIMPTFNQTLKVLLEKSKATIHVVKQSSVSHQTQL